MPTVLINVYGGHIIPLRTPIALRLRFIFKFTVLVRVEMPRHKLYRPGDGARRGDTRRDLNSYNNNNNNTRLL